MEEIYVELMTPTMEDARYAANKGMPYMGSTAQAIYPSLYAWF